MLGESELRGTAAALVPYVIEHHGSHLGARDLSALVPFASDADKRVLVGEAAQVFRASTAGGDLHWLEEQIIDVSRWMPWRVLRSSGTALLSTCVVLARFDDPLSRD